MCNRGTRNTIDFSCMLTTDTNTTQCFSCTQEKKGTDIKASSDSYQRQQQSSCHLTPHDFAMFMNKLFAAVLFFVAFVYAAPLGQFSCPPS